MAEKARHARDEQPRPLPSRGLRQVDLQRAEFAPPERAGEPSASSARSRRPIMLSGHSATICISTSAVAGAFPALAVPIVRRIPRSTTFTPSWLVGGSWPAIL